MFFGPEIQNYGNPTGWQAVSRYNPSSGQTLLIVHTFGGELPEQIQIPVNAVQIKDILCSENNEVTLQKNSVSIQLKENFEAIAIALTEYNISFHTNIPFKRESRHRNCRTAFRSMSRK